MADPSSSRLAAPSTWHFGPPDAAVVVRNAEALMAHLAVHLGGWPVRHAGDAPPPPEIDVIVAGAADIGLAFADAPPLSFDDPPAAAGALADALVTRFAAKAGRLDFAAAAVAAPGGLVCLVGPPRSGRTLLALQLAVIGWRLHADSRLAVRVGQGAPAGLCLGLTPRLSMPLPPDVGPALAEFVDGYLEIRNGRDGYLKLWAGEAAGFGDEAAIRAVVEIAREEGAEPVLAEAGTHPVLGVPAFTLRYGRSAEAARVVYRRFSGRA
ncbi:MAG: hypothetical protein AB7K86_05115 [Rhodospirillales bacterium]